MRPLLAGLSLALWFLAPGCGSGSGRQGAVHDVSMDAAEIATDQVSDLSDVTGEGHVWTEEGHDAGMPESILGLSLRMDGVLYAGAAAVDITPELGPGKAVYLAGFGRNRLAETVRDPLWARALVLSKDREYVAVVALDLVGMTGYRSGLAAAELAEKGWSRDRLLVHTTHTHAGPDTLGMWGTDYSHSGLDPEYQDRLVSAIVESVEEAAASARPAILKAGSLPVGSVSTYFTSPEFGGKGPIGRTVGLIRDSRDPVVTDDTLTAVGLFDALGDAIAVIAHVNTHVEVSGGGHEISSDFAHALRTLLENRFGGVGILWIGAEGGLQTPLDVPIPATDASGAIVWAACDQEAVDSADPECEGAAPGDPRVDPDGDPIPTWTSEEDWERTDSYGRLLGGLAADLIDGAAADESPELEVEVQPIMLPIQNRYLQVFGRAEDTSILDPLVELIDALYPEYKEYIQDLYDAFEAAILDSPEEHTVTGPDCPWEVAGEVIGCLPSRMWFLKVGPLGVLTAPGELLPEVWKGTPGGPEFDDASLRGPGSTWFGYSDPDCGAVDYEQCRLAVEIGDCDCLKAHAAPYRISHGDPEMPPMISYVDAPFPVLLGLTAEMTGYIIPEPDNTLLVSRPLSEMFGLPAVLDTVAYSEHSEEHYEESVSLGPAVSTILLQAAAELFAR